MRVLQVRNVIEALPTGLELLRTDGDIRQSRNGEVLLYPGPVTTLYERPMERVLFWNDRDANPFFHLHESLWMLGGRRDVASVEEFVKGMQDFSDDGETFNAAYGYRWRNHYGYDQLSEIINRLREDPDDRRCVLAVWDGVGDLKATSKDIPCNTHAYFTRNYLGALEMTVLCRSNDIIWGAYGANAVHWSMLQEYMAACIGCEVGSYWQVSNNYHAYTRVFDPLMSKFRTSTTLLLDPYRMDQVEPFPLFYGTHPGNLTIWHSELWDYLGETRKDFVTPFFAQVAVPLRNAYRAHKAGDADLALRYVQECQASDWRLACNEWLDRRRQD